ncbi:hypothetical protein C8R43DRAFT_506946 [Mycena crocata]|nr:hypothetical protein C8R43DRAFT_506946 [Mycena crocata]
MYKRAAPLLSSYTHPMSTQPNQTNGDVFERKFLIGTPQDGRCIHVASYGTNEDHPDDSESLTQLSAMNFIDFDTTRILETLSCILEHARQEELVFAELPMVWMGSNKAISVTGFGRTIGPATGSTGIWYPLGIADGNGEDARRVIRLASMNKIFQDDLQSGKWADKAWFTANIGLYLECGVRCFPLQRIDMLRHLPEGEEIRVISRHFFDNSNGPRGKEEVEKRQKMIDEYRKELSSEDGATEKRNADSEVEV